MHPGWKKNYFRYKSIFLNAAENYQTRPDIKVYLELILSLVTVCILSIFALRPTLLTISRLYKEIESKKDTLQTLKNKTVQIDKARDNYYSQENSIKLIFQAIPQKPYAEHFSANLHVLSLESSVQFTNLGVSEYPLINSLNKLQGEQTLGYSLIVNGTYQNLNAFLNKISNIRRVASIDQVTMGQNIDREGNKTITLYLNGVINYIP